MLRRIVFADHVSITIDLNFTSIYLSRKITQKKEVYLITWQKYAWILLAIKMIQFTKIQTLKSLKYKIYDTARKTYWYYMMDEMVNELSHFLSPRAATEHHYITYVR